MRRSILAMLLAAGCTQSPSSSPSSPTDEGFIEPAPTYPSDQSCANGVSSSIVDTQIATMQETSNSYHEMIACGGLAYQMSSSVYQILVGSLLESGGVDVPGGYVYDGEGRYVTGSGGATMYVTYLFGDDLQVGNEDDLVVENLFDFDNYLQGVSVSVDPLTQEVLVSYSATGPLVELLGEGASPPNPIRLSMEDIEAPYRIGRLKMVLETIVEDVRTGATVTYTLGAGPSRINPMLSGNSALTFDLTASSTLAADGARLTSTDVGIDYDDSPGVLDGQIPFQIRGGDLDLDGVFTFAQSTTATVDWWCPE